MDQREGREGTLAVGDDVQGAVAGDPAGDRVAQVAGVREWALHEDPAGRSALASVTLTRKA